MYEFIIVEGIDRVGKTSIKRRLDKALNYKYIIIDRLFLTSFAYEELKSRGNDIEFINSIVDKFCKTFKVLYIYIKISNFDLIRKRCIKDDEDVISIEEVEKLCNIYESVVNNFKLRTEDLDVDIFTIDVEQFNYIDFDDMTKYIIKENNL